VCQSGLRRTTERPDYVTFKIETSIKVVPKSETNVTTALTLFTDALSIPGPQWFIEHSINTVLEGIGIAEQMIIMNPGFQYNTINNLMWHMLSVKGMVNTWSKSVRNVKLL
jgi:hypothetical protein